MRKKVQKKLNFFKYPNCFQANENQILKEISLFDNENPIVLELGSGKATFSLQLARNHPKQNFIAIDTKINRLADGAKIALEENLHNIVFIQMHIEQILLHFDYQSVDNIWITFPDPYPKDRHEKHRLTNLKFLNYYHHILKPNGKIFFKTDNQELFEYTLNVLETVHWKPLGVTFDLYQSPLITLDNSIPTEYEKKFLKQGKKICYLELKNTPHILENIPLEPIPVFSSIKQWTPTPEIWNLEPLKPYQNQPDALVFEEYDMNMQFARTNDFEKFFWIIIKGEVRVEVVKKEQQKQIQFNEYGQVIDFYGEDSKIYGITLQRTLLVKVPKSI